MQCMYIICFCYVCTCCVNTLGVCVCVGGCGRGGGFVGVWGGGVAVHQ